MRLCRFATGCIGFSLAATFAIATTVSAQTCPTRAPGNVRVAYVGISSLCDHRSGGPPCRFGEIVQFQWLPIGTNGYQVQSCDTLMWDFGDGTTARYEGGFTQHIFRRVGTFRVTATITNTMGSSQSFTTDLVVIGDPDQPPRRRTVPHR